MAGVLPGGLKPPAPSRGLELSGGAGRPSQTVTRLRLLISAVVLLGAGCSSVLSIGPEMPNACLIRVGASVCSDVPRWQSCTCDGRERPATDQERSRFFCSTLVTVCDGEVTATRPCAEAWCGRPPAGGETEPADGGR